MITCPRRVENGMEDGPFVGAGKNLDDYVGRLGRYRQCTYCGSLEPETFLALMAAGVELGVTDKNYKAYVDYAGHWKFYFQHFSVEQRHDFIQMLNDKTILFGWPGYFTVLPYFIGRA